MKIQDEKEIIQLVKEGKSNKEIARTVFKSVGTIKQYVSVLLKKYNCENRVQLAVKDFEQETNLS